MDWDGKETLRLGFGCGSVMGRAGRRTSLRAMNAAWEAGIRLFDTARSYGYGEAEGLLGEFLRGRRGQAIVVTKFGIASHRPARWKRLAKPLVRTALTALPQARTLLRRPLAGQLSAGHFDVPSMRRSLEKSLRELQTDYVDALLVHEAPASVMAQGDLMAALEDVVREGKALRVGMSCAAGTAAEALRQGPAHLSVLQFPANLLDADTTDWPASVPPERLLIANHLFGGPVRANSVIAGLQSLAKDPALPAALRERMRQDVQQGLAETTFAAVQRRTPGAFLLTSMLHPDHLRVNLAALQSPRLTAAELDLLEQRLRGSAGR